MRAALWLLALFAVAAAVALFAGNNQGTITVFWPPWRVDLSLNLVLVILLAAFALLHLALRGQSRDEPVPYSSPPKTTVGTPCSMYFMAAS